MGFKIWWSLRLGYPNSKFTICTTIFVFSFKTSFFARLGALFGTFFDNFERLSYLLFGSIFKGIYNIKLKLISSVKIWKGTKICIFLIIKSLKESAWIVYYSRTCQVRKFAFFWILHDWHTYSGLGIYQPLFMNCWTNKLSLQLFTFVYNLIFE